MLSLCYSSRYASQVSSKLSCFWALSPVGRPRSIIGILNSLDMKDSLAATGMPLSQVGARGAGGDLQCYPHCDHRIYHFSAFTLLHRPMIVHAGQRSKDQVHALGTFGQCKKKNRHWGAVSSARLLSWLLEETIY